MKQIRSIVFLAILCISVSTQAVTKSEPRFPGKGAGRNPEYKTTKNNALMAPPAALACTATVSNYVSLDTQGAITLTVSGGTPPYTIDWDGYHVPANHDYYVQMQSSGVYTMVDTVRLYAQLDSLRGLTNKRFLSPNVHYAHIKSTAGDSLLVAAVVGNTLNWAGLSGISSTNTVTASKTIGSWTYLPSPGINLQKTASAGLSNNYAISQNLIYSSEYNYAQCQISDITNQMYFGMIPYSQNAAGDAPTTGYYFNLNAKSAACYSGTVNLGNVNYVMGDVFSIRVLNGVVYYFKNDVSINSVSMTAGIYQLKTVFNQASASLAGIKLINAANLPALPLLPHLTGGLSSVVTDATCQDACSGSIAVTAFPGVFVSTTVNATNFQLFAASDLINPISTYTLSAATFSYTMTGICAGDYLVKFNYTTNGSAQSLSQALTVAYMPDWTNQVNAASDPTTHTLSKTASVNWNSGANSANELEYNVGSTEFYEFIPNLSGAIQGCVNSGLTFRNATNYASAAPADIQFGFYIQSFPSLASSIASPPGNTPVGIGSFFIFDRQNNPVLPPVMTYFNSDRFKITKTGAAFKFYRNDQQIYTTYFYTSAPNLASMVADASLFRLGHLIQKPRVSFGCPTTPVYALLNRQLDGHYYAMSKNRLYFKYDEEYADKDSKLQLNIYNAQNQKVLDAATLSPGLLPMVNFGDNYYLLDLNNTSYTGGSTLPGGYYVLEVINEKAEKWYLRFKK